MEEGLAIDVVPVNTFSLPKSPLGEKARYLRGRDDRCRKVCHGVDCLLVRLPVFFRRVILMMLEVGLRARATVKEVLSEECCLIMVSRCVLGDLSLFCLGAEVREGALCVPEGRSFGIESSTTSCPRKGCIQVFDVPNPCLESEHDSFLITMLYVVRSQW